MPRQHLTPNACLVCRKKRTKCDGQMPCRRCRSRGEECAYEDKKWRTKDHLRSEIERLRTEQRQGHAVIQALTNHDPQRWEAVLERMRDHEPPDSIAQWICSTAGLPVTIGKPEYMGSDGIRHGNTAPESRELRCGAFPESSFGTPHQLRFGPRLTFPSPSPGPVNRPFPEDVSPTHVRDPRRFAFPPPQLSDGSPGFPVPDHRGSIQSCTSDSSQSTGADFPIWTRVTPDTQLVRRLILRVFASETFCTPLLVPRLPFVRDAHEGGRRYCHEALINALLGWSCKMLDASSQVVSQVSFGDAFLGEAKILLSAEESHVNIPSIQALSVLAWAEMAEGNGEEACSLAEESVRSTIHLALRSPPDQGDEEFRDVRALSYCGGFTMMRMLRLLAGQVEPSTGPLFMRLQSGSGDAGQDAPGVRLERGISLQMRFFSELQFCPPVARFVFEVTEIVHTFLSYNFSKAMTAADLEEAYGKCLGCLGKFAEQSSPDIASTPDQLFAHIWYQHCLLSLLRPFVRGTTSLVDRGTPRLPNDATPALVCRQSSGAVIFLTSTYQTRYSLKHPPPLLPYVVFAAILHQLTLHVDVRSGLQEPPPFMETPVQMPSGGVLESPRYPSSFPSHIPLTDRQAFRGPASLSPTHAMQAQWAARRRAMSSPSACPPINNGHVRPNTSDLTPSASSDRGEGSSSGASASYDILPAFTSVPADLVTVGSLQLASMRERHGGAATVARLLHSAGPVDTLAGSNVDLTGWAKSLPLQPDGFLASAVWTGLGLERNVASPGQGLVGLGISGQPPVQGFADVGGVYGKGAAMNGDGVRSQTPRVCSNVNTGLGIP
ncbi:hypothetical protein QBC34DRAFT_288582 [Podospora aff. communis PSN243]|uniref:Zn(2)-C6 fungal-type domain-containing protein n=1 Tax=Podospora aff. communis PSN243 TaxID=3040156 RepID=A0AAV9H4I7_9PEZI|nr:hypothetical protein QBC34DRAFT_288582 [Podospora aff. communis PSN243]